MDKRKRLDILGTIRDGVWRVRWVDDDGRLMVGRGPTFDDAVKAAKPAEPEWT